MHAIASRSMLGVRVSIFELREPRTSQTATAIINVTAGALPVILAVQSEEEMRPCLKKIGQRAALLHEQEVVVSPLWKLSTNAARLQPSSAGPLTLVVADLPFATSPSLRPCTIGASISKESRLTVYIDKTASAKIPRGRTVGRRTKQPRRCSIKTRSGDRPLDRQNKAFAARWGFFNQNTIANAIRLRAALNSNAAR